MRSANRLSGKVLARDQARVLRKDSTDAENKLWQKLKNRQLSGFKFRRQHPIGPYIADFACVAHGLVIELDGSQHTDHLTNDSDRSRFIHTSGFKILRFTNDEILLDLESILERIACFLIDPHPNPLPSGGFASQYQSAP